MVSASRTCLQRLARHPDPRTTVPVVPLFPYPLFASTTLSSPLSCRAAEMLCALPPPDHGVSSRLRVRGVPGAFELYDTAPGCEDVEDVLSLAVTYFEAREFMRALHLLDTHYEPLVPQASGGEAPSAPPRLPWTAKALFVRCYAQYLVSRTRQRDGKGREEQERGIRAVPAFLPFTHPPPPTPTPTTLPTRHAGGRAPQRDAAPGEVA